MIHIEIKWYIVENRFIVVKHVPEFHVRFSCTPDL